MQTREKKNVLGKMLSKCVQLLKADGRVEGTYVVGSMADGTFDDYSDIDINVVVKDEAYAGFYEERFRFAEQIGDLLSTFEVEWLNCQMLGAIYRNYVEVDFCYTTLEKVEVFSDRYKILLDRTGRVRQNLVKKDFMVDARKELKTQTDFALYNVLHAFNMLKRGEYWSLIKQIETLRRRLVTLMDLSLGKDVAEEYRRLESLFPLEVETKLRKTLCVYSKKEIEKSLVAATQLFCEVGQDVASRLSVEFSSERFAHLLKNL